MKKLVLDEITVKNVERLLRAFTIETRVTSVLVINTSGQILFQNGQKNDDYFNQSIGALCSGIFNATRSIAKLLKEDYFLTLFQEGKKYSFFYYAITDDLILISIFTKNAIIGVIQVMSQKVCQNILSLMKEEEENITFDAQFKNEIENILNDIFNK